MWCCVGLECQCRYEQSLQLRFLIVPELLEWFLYVPWLFCLEACGRMGQACLALLRNVAVP